MLKRNIAANIAGRATALALQALLLPFYLRLLGIEAVGLIGFYTAMLTALGVVEYAIGTMILREMAKLSEGENRGRQRDLLRTTEIFYVIVVLVVGLLTSVAAPTIVRLWLSRSSLGEERLIQCVVLMGWTVALQLFWSLYLNVLNGLERQFITNMLSLALTCVRGFGALAVLLTLSTTVEAYFVTQLMAILLILAVSASAAWRALPQPGHAAAIRPGLLLSTWQETRSHTGTAILFVFLFQADKLIASYILSLKEFGYYVIAGMIASVMWAIYGSIGTALLPRFTRLLTLDATDEVRRLFHASSQFVSVILLPIAVVTIFHADALVMLWTGDGSIATKAAPIVALLTFGTLLACLACASNFLQLAAGFTELPLLNNIVLIVGLPISYYATLKFGPSGTTAMWLLSGTLQLTLAPSLLHRRILKNEQARWYLKDIGAPVVAAALVGGASLPMIEPSTSKIVILIQLGCVWAIASAAVLAVSPIIRSAAQDIVRRFIKSARSRRIRT